MNSPHFFKKAGATFIMILGSLLLFNCASRKISNINYVENLPETTTEKAPDLNIFTPKDTLGKKMPVLIFVHGGNWHSGNKNMYSFIGRNFAKKNVLTVIPSYTISRII